MAHHSVESMRDRAFTKGRAAFKNDAEYQAALRGEIDDLDETTEEQVDMGRRFRDVLNGTPDLEEDDLDCIARRLKGFRDGTTGELLVFAGHFTLKPAEISARKVVIVVDVRGEFAMEIDDALGVVSEMAEAMECADREPPEENRENPVLAALFDEIEDAEMDELPDFLSNDKYGDIDLNCGKSLKWRDGVLPERKLVVIDDPDQQNWSVVSREEFTDAFAKACSQRRLEKLEEMLGCLPDAVLDKIIGTARQVVANGYSVGIRLEIKDEDDWWVADIKVLPEGKVRFGTDDGTVEVLGRELLETAEAARGMMT